MFKKIFIANRGEIAVRIIRTCRRMGIGTVAVYSDVDVRSLHVNQADESICLGGTTSSESYLSREKIITAALSCGCEAIHPGYGFLSENARFAEAVADAGLTFIGPPASAIRLLGDKIASKKLAEKAGLPVVPGHFEPLVNVEDTLAVADEIGYPVLLKPTGGGGGKGMHIVNAPDEMSASLTVCRREVRKAFGDDKIFMERYISKARHVEIQIMADRFGNVVHLGERECSIQRRYQKIIEEAPSVAVNPSLRDQMGTAACDLARQAGYVNAGTVEFMLDPEGRFYFLEVNTRLQVEHPVTEMITGLDLVELQLQIACGEPMALCQDDVSIRGWSIEARICAEDPDRGFIPSTGMITRYAEPRGRHIRVDSGVTAGSLISVYYDSMMAKVIAWGDTRQKARTRLVDALNGYHVEGPVTNIDFANAILNHPAFVQGQLSTDFIVQHMENPAKRVDPPVQQLHYMVLATVLVYHNRRNLVVNSLKPMAASVGGATKPRWLRDYTAKAENDIFSIRLRKDHVANKWTLWINEKQYEVVTPEFEFYRRRIKLLIDGRYHRFRLQYQCNFIRAAFCGLTRTIEIYSPREWKLSRYTPSLCIPMRDDILECPMPGLVVDVRVKKGSRVYRGQELVILESMKMEIGVASPCDGEISEVLAQKGQTVETGDILIKFCT